MEEARLDDLVMAIHEQIESTAAFVTEWWDSVVGRRLPGEAGGITVYGIEFWDGCRFFDYTQGSVFERVSELGFRPGRGLAQSVSYRNTWWQVAYIGPLRWPRTSTVVDAVELVTRLVLAAPRGMELRGKRGCWSTRSVSWAITRWSQ